METVPLPKTRFTWSCADDQATGRGRPICWNCAAVLVCIRYAYDSYDNYVHCPITRCSGGRKLAAHGGFCVAVLMITAQRHYREVEMGPNSAIPISIHTEFLEPMPPGEFHVRTELLQRGKRHNLIRAELVPSDPKQTRVYSTALVRLGTLDFEDDPKDRQPLLSPIPDRIKDCDRWTDSVYYTVNPPSSSIRVFCPNDKGNPLWSDIFGGQNCRYQWTKLDDESFFSTEYLPILADLVRSPKF